MDAANPIDDLLLSAIDRGSLDESTARDSDLVATFSAHQKLEGLFKLLREPARLAAEPEDPPSPGTIGRYLIRKELGRGAFGVVYLADDPELKRAVAIKVQRGQNFSSTARADAFLNEARLAAQLRHPGIVPVHDVGRDGERCYIVMSYIEGRTLEDLLKSERLPPRRVAELLAQVAEAIHYAHGKGFYHRDLKPANILLDAAGKPHVSDFGLAVTDDNQRLFTNQVAGTPAYMSPEQIRGEAHYVDGRTDIWSLGVILYETLTGRHPFWKGNVVNCLDEIHNRDPKPPRQIDDTIPPALESIALRCMAKNITDRFNTAADVAGAIRSWLSVGDNDARAANAGTKGVGVFTLPPALRSPFILVPLCVAMAVALFFLVRPALQHPVDPTRTPLESKAGSDVSNVVASVDVLVWNEFDPARRRISLTANDALPLRPGDGIRVEVAVSKACYLYILWIGSDGIVQPVYPWTPGKWSERPVAETPVKSISLPSNPSKGWPLGGSTGMETLLLLARDTPLPHEVNLQELSTDLPKQTLHDPRTIAWFDNGRLITNGDRAPQFFNEQLIDDPMLQTQQTLNERLRPHFPIIKGVSFGYQSDATK